MEKLSVKYWGQLSTEKNLTIIKKLLPKKSIIVHFEGNPYFKELYLIFLRLTILNLSIEQMERKKQGISQADTNLMEYVTETADLLRNLSKYYDKSFLAVKQKVIGSIYIEKLIFEENEYRTIELNEVIAQIRKLGADYEQQKKRLASNFGSQSEEVNRIGHFSNHFFSDLRSLVELNA